MPQSAPSYNLVDDNENNDMMLVLNTYYVIHPGYFGELTYCSLLTAVLFDFYFLRAKMYT